MCSIRLRKQKVSSENAAQIGLTCADHKGHRQSRQLHSTSKAAEDRRTPRRKRRIELAVTLFHVCGRVRQCSAALDPGKASIAATRFRLAIGDQPESRPVPEPIKHGTLAVSGLRFRLRAPTERKAAIAASDMMKSTTMVISRKSIFHMRSPSKPNPSVSKTRDRSAGLQKYRHLQVIWFF